jgi:hypothetical protein
MCGQWGLELMTLKIQLPNRVTEWPPINSYFPHLAWLPCARTGRTMSLLCTTAPAHPV